MWHTAQLNCVCQCIYFIKAALDLISIILRMPKMMYQLFRDFHVNDPIVHPKLIQAIIAIIDQNPFQTIAEG